jgi:uncharacterized protein (TIGR01370 family)
MSKRKEKHKGDNQLPCNGLISRRSMAMALLAPLAVQAADADRDCWLVYYGSTAPAEAFRPYSTVILDSRYHPALPPLAKAGKKLIGYISIGEASPDYSYFEQLKSEGLLIRSSNVWQGNQYIDIRDSRWQRRLLDELIPAVLAQGFQGLFLDTLDSPLYLEQTDPAAYQGMADAAATIIRSIRTRFANATVVMNRAYKLLDNVAGDIDIVVGESVFTTYNFRTKRYGLVDDAAYRHQVQLLQDAVKRSPNLRVFTLDYWDPADMEGIGRIYREERANGFKPYVTTIDLAKIVKEPPGNR